jgi:hypothetical protein
MGRVSSVVALIAAVGLTGPALADTYTVTHPRDGDVGSLRWALEQANLHDGADLVRFAARMNGKTIRPASQLPILSDDQTTINGDIDGDGAPNVEVNGANAGVANGLQIGGTTDCTVTGLAINGFQQGYAIAVFSSHRCRVRSCHLGADLAGTQAKPNVGDVCISQGDDNVIGGTTPRRRNVIAGSFAGGLGGVVVSGGARNVVCGNYVGLTRDGSQSLGTGGVGINMQSVTGYAATANVIGGTTAGAGNLFGGLLGGVFVNGASDCTIAGNRFGLGADGEADVPITDYCMTLIDITGFHIGGTTAEARNVMADAGQGILLWGDLSVGNVIQGNYFGLNAAGSAPRALPCGLTLWSGAGAQTIGGSAPGAGNVFVPNATSPGWTYGIYLNYNGSGSLIRGNRFGVMPDGTEAPLYGNGIVVYSVQAKVTDNVFAMSQGAVGVGGATAHVDIHRNVFRSCGEAVRLMNDAHCNAGNLGNASHADDGGNVFRSSNTWFFTNNTPNNVKAEGNSFGTTSRDAISAKIWDRIDDASLGVVDFDPLAGGVHPSGIGPAALGIAGVTAVRRAPGAEIAFTLSAPARVTVAVLNLAGRPIAVLAHEATLTAGLQRLTWSGLASAGVRAPAGRYLVRITVTGDGGEAAQALCALELR